MWRVQLHFRHHFTSSHFHLNRWLVLLYQTARMQNLCPALHHGPWQMQRVPVEGLSAHWLRDSLAHGRCSTNGSSVVSWVLGPNFYG